MYERGGGRAKEGERVREGGRERKRENLAGARHGGVEERVVQVQHQRQLPAVHCLGFRVYRGTSLIRNTHPPRTTLGPQAGQGYCRVLRGGGVL